MKMFEKLLRYADFRGKNQKDMSCDGMRFEAMKVSNAFFWNKN